MRDCLEIIEGMQIPVKEVRLGGGGGRSPFWRQLQADIYGKRCVTTNATEGPAFGVALLAAVGTGAYKDVPEACKATIKVTDESKPDAKSQKVYNRVYPLYGKLYRSLKDDYRAISELVAG